MDAERIDQLARAAAIAGSRRRLLRALAAGVAGGVLFRRRAISAGAQETGATGPRRCAQDGDCVNADGDACTGGRCENGTCVYSIVTCVPGYVCCGNGECCPETAGGGGLGDRGNAGADTVVDGSSDGADAGGAAADAGPVQLPNTGTGGADSGDGGRWRAALALLSAGAVVAAHRVRRAVGDPERPGVGR